MSTNNNTNQEGIDTVIDLFGWTYGVAFRPDQRATIQAEILHGFSNTDASDVELMSNLTDLHNYLAEINAKLKAEVDSFFQTNFNLEEGNDRSRILVTIYRAIVELLSENSPVFDVPPQGNVNEILSSGNADSPEPFFPSSSPGLSE